MARQKIEKLTAELEAALPSFREKWRRIGLSTQAVDPEEARTSIRRLYRAGGLEEPKAVLVLSSPAACLLARALIEKTFGERRSENHALVKRDQLGAQLRDQLGAQLRDQLWGQLGGQLGDQLWDQLGAQNLYRATYFWGGQDAHWVAFFEFCRLAGAKFEKRTAEHFSAYQQYARTCGWLYAFPTMAFVSDRPEELHFDEARRLHNDAGMAVRFRDGWGVYSWHGLRLPPSHEWIIAEPSRLTPDAIDAEPNTEFRRVMLEAFGFERYMAARDAKVISVDELHGQPRRLLEVHAGGEPVRIVEVVNGSPEPDGTRRKFHLGAMPGDTCHEVIAASYGIRPEHYREAVRT